MAVRNAEAFLASRFRIKKVSLLSMQALKRLVVDPLFSGLIALIATDKCFSVLKSNRIVAKAFILLLSQPK